MKEARTASKVREAKKVTKIRKKIYDIFLSSPSVFIGDPVSLFL